MQADMLGHSVKHYINQSMAIREENVRKRH